MNDEYKELYEWASKFADELTACGEITINAQSESAGKLFDALFELEND